MTRRWLLVLLLVSTRGLAQAPGPEEALARQAAAVMRAWPDSVRAQAELLLDSASRRAIPMAPLYTKVREGAAKGAAPDVIVQVVRQLEGALTGARGILGPSATEGELTAAAAALQSGVGPASIEGLRQALRSSSSLTVAMVVLTDLVRRGVEPAVAGRALERLATAGATDATFSLFRTDVVNDLSSGTAPLAAVNRAADDVLSRQLQVPGVRRPPPP